MQYDLSTSTTPSGLSKVAPTGHTCTHGEFAQWLHSFGTKNTLTFSSAGFSSGNPS